MKAPTLYGPGPEEPEPLRPVQDLRGTPVDDVDGRYTGEVYGALTDADHGLIRYLDVALADSGKHILVPLGHVRIERELTGGLSVRLRGARREDLQEIPPFEPHDVDLDDPYQRSLLAAHGRIFHGERYYAHPVFDHGGLFAGEHPIERGPVGRPGGRPLVRLSDLDDFRIAEGEPDIRGWPLITRDRANVGTVTDLVIQPEAKKVRYAVVDLEPGPRPTLIPIGYLEVHPDVDEVRTPRLDRDDILALPTHTDEVVSREDENRVREILEERLDGERRFDRPDFSDSDLRELDG